MIAQNELRSRALQEQNSGPPPTTLRFDDFINDGDRLCGEVSHCGPDNPTSKVDAATGKPGKQEVYRE